MLHGKRKTFTRSLQTSNWGEARRIRDTEFSPIILSMDKAQAQMELIQRIYPELEKQLHAGVHRGYAPAGQGDSRFVPVGSSVVHPSRRRR